jgi:glycosyltransferase involved in cell wall biosynthesis
MQESDRSLELKDQFLLSVVVPVYNEEEVLNEFHRRLALVLDKLPADSEVIYVNDGSLDNTLKAIERLRDRDHRVAIVDLSRNYGKDIALTAGLDHSKGEAVVVIDADLQDPPELILEMVAAWKDGCEMVYAKRIARQGESFLKKATANIFYRLIQLFSSVKIPRDTGDFRLLSRQAADALLQMRERNRFMKGMFAWIGYSQKAIYYRRDPRYAGNTKWSYWRLWNFALDGLTSFTIAPLKISTYLGLTIAFGAFVYGACVVIKTLLYGDPVRGYPSLMVVILFLGGIQLIGIGIIGEYLGRMFDEIKQRPLYFTKTFHRARNASQQQNKNHQDSEKKSP